MENFENTDWEALSSSVDNEAEMKRIRKNIRKQNLRIVLSSVILVLILLLITFQYAVPALEKQYWNPQEKSFDDVCTDFSYTTQAYTELNFPHLQINSVDSIKTGFAQYDLRFYSYPPYPQDVTNTVANSSILYGSLDRNALTLPSNLATELPFLDFDTFGYHPSLTLERSQLLLNQLPDYFTVYAAVSFTNDIGMEGLAEWGSRAEANGAEIGWVGIRTTSDTVHSLYPMYGMKPFSDVFTSNTHMINETYPAFIIQNYNAETLEAHFKALLQYSQDQIIAGRGIGDEDCMIQYQDALNYAEENGIYSYGCYISASPAFFRGMLDRGAASTVIIKDVWIDC